MAGFLALTFTTELLSVTTQPRFTLVGKEIPAKAEEEEEDRVRAAEARRWEAVEERREEVVREVAIAIAIAIAIATARALVVTKRKRSEETRSVDKAMQHSGGTTTKSLFTHSS